MGVSKMSNLKKRVEKAKELVFSHNPYDPSRYQTWGSESKDYGEKYYRVELSHTRETTTIQDIEIEICVFLVDCQKDNGKETCNCPGNEYHNEVCKHGLGAIYQSFKNKGKLVRFFETYETAKQISFGGKIAKVKSVKDGSYLWCVVKDWPKKKPELFQFQKDVIDWSIKKGKLSAQENINLMRGSEDDEGID
jgi:hypothetical protein